MLLVNAQQEVLGFFKRVKDMPERKEGDTIIKTKKDAIAANLGDHWPKAEKPVKDPNAPKVDRPAVPTEGKYKVKEGFAAKSKEGNAGRVAMFEVLNSTDDIAEFLANAKEYEFNGKKVTPKSCMGYVIRKGIVTLV